MSEQKKRRQNNPERIEMLANRYAEQRGRTTGYERMALKPRSFVGKDWDPRTGKVERLTQMVGVPSWQNRRTGKPHRNRREVNKPARLAMIRF
jgi:hypothetical protein